MRRLLMRVVFPIVVAAGAVLAVSAPARECPALAARRLALTGSHGLGSLQSLPSWCAVRVTMTAGSGGFRPTKEDNIATDPDGQFACST